MNDKHTRKIRYKIELIWKISIRDKIRLLNNK